MIAAPGVAAVLATRQATLVDLVTLTIRRGSVWLYDGNGTITGSQEILDTVRWTTAPRPLRTSATAPDGGRVYQPLAGVACQRGTLRSASGAEVQQLDMTVTGTLGITLATAQDGSGAFATTLGELALLGLLEGAQITIDQAVVTDLPSTPVAAGPGYGILSPDPVRVFAGVVRGVTPSSYGIEFECCDPLILGGGSVPRNVFSPACRWEFASGRVGGVGCPVVRRGGVTMLWFSGSTVAFPDASSVTIPQSGLPAYGTRPLTEWAFLVPQDGPMMGMRFQVGQWRSGALFDFADRLPWAWGCTQVALEFTCSKGYAAGVAGSGAGCTDWAGMNFNQVDTRPGFGGFPDMPQPEAA